MAFRMNSLAAIPKTVVLSGATGFLGRTLCRALVARGHTVHAYHRAASHPASLFALPESVQRHLLPAEMEAPFVGQPKPDAVIHCAALYGRKGESAADLIEANTLLPVRLRDLAAKHGVPMFFNTDTVLDPALNAYALSKHQAVAWLRRDSAPPRIVNLRLQHFYGPGDDPSKFIAALVAQCAASVPEISLTDGRQRRDFLFVDDAVSAYVALLENDDLGRGGGPGFSEFEVGSGEAVAVREIVERIHALTHSRSLLKFGALPHRAGEPMLTQADTTALRALGWRPATSLEEGLRQTVAATLGETL
jgi:CDP-paratose synthetase